MALRTPLAVLIVTAVAVVASGPALAQHNVQGTPGAAGDYQFFWTTDTGTTAITSLNANPGTTVAVRLWLRETGATGNLLGNASQGIASYDTRTTWTGGTSTLALALSGTGGTNNTFIRTNPYTGGVGFTGPGGTVTNDATVAANNAQALNLGRAVLGINDPTTWVHSGLTPNAVGSLLINQLTFQVPAGATAPATLTGGQNTGLTNWQYGFDTNGTTSLFFDDRIGAANATLVINPVPEPASVLLVGAAGMGVAAGVRRWRKRRTAAG